METMENAENMENMENVKNMENTESGTGAAPAANRAVLKAEDLNVYYGSIHAIKGVSFEVFEGGERRGEIHDAEYCLRPVAQPDRVRDVLRGIDQPSALS